jgi:hypothetical protein
MPETQAQRVRFTAKDVDIWVTKYCEKHKAFCDNTITRASIERYVPELKYIAAHWEAARNGNITWLRIIIAEYEKPMIDPKNAPTKFDLIDAIYRQMRLNSITNIRGYLKI